MEEIKSLQKKYEIIIKKLKFMNELIWRKKIFVIIEFPKKIHPRTLK